MDLHELSCFLERVSANPDAPLEGADSALLEQACAEFPYSGALQLLRLRHALVAGGDGCLDELKMRVALMSSDARTLAYAGHGSDWSALCPEPASGHEMPTEDVIDTFLRTYGNCSAEEEALLERMIFNPTPDYAEMLAREEQSNLPSEGDDGDPDSQDARINAFIRSQHPAAAHEPEPEALPEPSEQTPIPRPEHTDDSLLSESLAQIFIKRGRYERAYEIISGLNLKFPKKSAYFADQLRFLQKLIINQRHLSGQDARPEINN